MTKRFSGALAALLIFSVLLTSCGTLNYLELAIGAAELALPLIGPSAGIDAGTVMNVEMYLAATSQAITKAVDIQNGTGTPAQKAAQIAAAFAGIAFPIVPAQYQTLPVSQVAAYVSLASAVSKVAAYVSQFLGTLPASSAASSPHVAVSTGGSAKLASIRARAQKVYAKTHH